MLCCTIIGDKPSEFPFRYNENAPLCCDIKQAMQKEFIRLYNEGVHTFLLGGAVGVDTWAAEILLDMRKQEEYQDLILKLVISYPGQPERYTHNQKKRYRRIWERCKKEDRVVISDSYSPDVYKKRNYFMVDNSHFLLAVYDTENGKRTGTAMTVNYAKKKGLIINIIKP